MKYSHGAFNVVICNQKVLLVKRRDFPLWDLPGGVVELDELPSQAAIREMYEETGYEIQIDYEFARYIDKTRNDCQHLFVSQIVGGKAMTQSSETCQLKWFPIAHLPFNLVSNRKRQIHDVCFSKQGAKYEISENILIRLIRKVLRLK